MSKHTLSRGAPTTYFPIDALFLDLEGLRAAHESQELQYFNAVLFSLRFYLFPDGLL
jgi:hypothetical protein